MEYERTQHGRVHYLLFALAGLTMFLIWHFQAADALTPGTTVAATLCLTGLVFATLTVRDEGDALSIRFGPLPVFRKRIPYADITAVERGRTSFHDFCGVHWTPGRGTTYGIWGFDCVKLTIGRNVIRVGTDDVDGVIALVERKMAQRSAPHSS